MRRVTMQRRHFELIAETIRLLAIPASEKLYVAGRFAGQLASTNPSFDYDRFIKAATGKDG